MCASPCIEGDLAQAFRAFLGCRIGWRRSFSHSRHQGINRRDYEEIDRCCNQEKRNCGIDEVTDRKIAAVNGEANGGEVGLAHQRGYKRSEKIFSEGSNHASESSPDNDAYGKVNHIAAKDKLLKSAEHSALLDIWRNFTRKP